jgi:hypothetical protein
MAAGMAYLLSLDFEAIPLAIILLVRGHPKSIMT